MHLDQFQEILFLEFINADQFPGQINSSIPLLKGFVDFLGKPSRWIRFALSTDLFYQQQSDEVQLRPDELETVQKALAELLPDLVVTTHRLGQEMRLLLEQQVPDAALAMVDEILWRQRPMSDFDGLQELMQSGSFAFTHELGRAGFAPSYRWEAGNAAANRHDRHNIYLLTAMGCGYREPVTGNPYYAGLDLPRNLSTGCAFCGAKVPPESSSSPTGKMDAATRTPVSWIRRQVETIARTLGPDRLPNALVLNDIERPEILEVTIDAMETEGLSSKVRLLAGLRVDRLLQVEGLLRQVPGGKGHGPTLQIFSCGIENFSDAELRRLNKGTTSLTNLKAVNLLKELESDLPGRFYYSGYMGLSVILFTPWTTLSDLHLNAGLISHLQLEGEIGNLFMSRLRLHRDLAITFLARHDQVITDNEEDDVLAINRRKLFAEELAWKHVDSRVEQVARLAVRLAPDRHLEGNELYEKVQQVFRSPAQGAGSPAPSEGTKTVLVRRLSALVEAAVEADATLNDAGLLQRARSILKTRVVSGQDPSWRLGERLRTLPEFLEEVLPLVRSEALPALSLRLPWTTVVSRDRLSQAVDGWSHVILDDPLDLSGQTSRLVVSGSLERLDRTVEALWRVSAGLDEGALREATVELLESMGMPGCCARACAQRDRGYVDAGSWWVLQDVLTDAARFPEGLSALVLGDLGFRPCQSGCPKAGAVLQEMQSLWGTLDLSGRSGHAFAFHLGARTGGELVPLPVLQLDDQSLTYDPGEISELPGALRAQLKRGNRLEFRPGQVQLWSGNRTLAFWTAMVGVIHPDRQWHRDEWLELAKAAIRNRDSLVRRRRPLVSLMAGRFVADPTIL